MNFNTIWDAFGTQGEWCKGFFRELVYWRFIIGVCLSLPKCVLTPLSRTIIIIIILYYYSCIKTEHYSINNFCMVFSCPCIIQAFFAKLMSATQWKLKWHCFLWMFSISGSFDLKQHFHCVSVIHNLQLYRLTLFLGISQSILNWFK